MNAPLARLTAALADRYRIERELGAGGMATVYLAEDIKHDRKVAVKVLRPELAAVIGAERFVVEIKTTAALQHPHILPLFDSGESDGFLWYAMPFIDGETLRAKLDRETQLGIDEALKITTAVADALDYAHRHGVVHRDIKPENILLHDGRPMVADFGIALALSAAAGGRMTETGMSLGTPHYMSPEQATADKEISARSDVYSLGSVLYEMLAGQPPHLGGSAQQIIMKIIAEQAAPVTSLRKAVPPHVAAAVARSLEKLPADRFESARAFADALGNPGFTHGTVAGIAGGPHRTGSRWRDPLTVGLAACTLIATVLAGWALGRPKAAGPVGWYAVALDSTSRMAYGGIGELARLSLTPDGRTLVYVGVRSAPGMELQRQLFVRRLGSLASQPIAGTEEGVRPAVSWDGAQVAFLADRNNPSISVVSLGGGPVLTLVTTEVESGPAWGPDGFVYYLTSTGMIRRVAGSGGPTEDVVQLAEAPDNGEYGWLTILPGGSAALVGSRPTGNRFGEESQYWLVAVDLATGKLGETLQGLAARYVAEAKTLIYVAPNGSIMAVPYDLKAMRSTGRPLVLAAGGSSRSGDTDFDVAGGTLAYTEQGRNGTEYLAWVNRTNGSVVPVDTAWRDTEFEAFALSPDGSRLAVTIGGSGAGRTQLGGSEQNNQTRYDVWVKQLDRGPISRRSFEGERNEQPSWSADGRSITYTSTREGKTALFRRRADGVGEEERIASPSDGNIIESRWSRDGRWLVASIRNRGSIDLMAMQLGVDTVLRPLLADPFFEAKPALSTDGAWLAYVSNESGTPQIFVRPFPNVTEGKWQISVEGGTDPVWRENGRELFFRSPDGNTVYAADMTRGPALAGVQRLFAAPATSSGFELNGVDRMFDVSPDGQRFLLSIDADLDASGNLVIVENFLTYLRDAMASGKANP